MAWSWRASFSDGWSQTSRPFPFIEGQEAIVSLGNEQLIDGYLEELSGSYDARTHRIELAGRSRTGQLADNSAIYKSGRWKNVPIPKIVEDLVADYDLGVTLSPEAAADPETVKPIRKFSIERGESVFDAIGRVARLRGLVVTSDARRNVVLSRATKVRKSPFRITRDVVLNSSRTGRWHDRHSRYVVLGQTAGNDQWSGDQAARGVAVVDDDEITANRPLITIAESQGGRSEYERQATWMRNRRAGEARKVTYTVRGWEHTAGLLWEPNLLVPVDDTWWGISGDMLLSRVTLMYGAQGQRAGLELVNPGAFDIGPISRKERSWL
jgi:prophage tail gpP-like protein